ncbi:MAG: cytochrome c biogenesis protein CcsA [Phycisphaerales bacterium]|nr:cytochrome c biogenesis protein CcsA [Phycisphaerales bacterium]
MNNHWSKYAAPAVAALLALVYFVMPLISKPAQEMSVASFGELPAAYGGRFKPLDTIARTSLLTISGRQSVRTDEGTYDASTWLLELIAQPERAAERPIFRVDLPELRATLALPEAKRYSINQLMEKRDELQRQNQMARMTDSNEQTLFHRKVSQLADQVSLYQTLSGLFNVNVIPPAQPGGEWLPLGMFSQPPSNEFQRTIVTGYHTAFDAARAHDARGFNRVVDDLHKAIRVTAPSIHDKARSEAAFNRAGVFQRATVLYLLSGLALMISWLRWRVPLTRTAALLLIVTILAHTLGIVTRIYLSGRPPVTNLYSSALFIGWGMVLLGIVLEHFFRSGAALFTAAVSGFLTLMVARGLVTTGSGDTMAVLQAVLDTNFWLATHVIIITLGYSSTYLAGLLGAMYIFRATLTRSMNKDESRRLGQMIYGIVCFATLASFVGTILGGIWADQSWGRFWGWDPKENGALIIVLWNALILHARWGGMARARGIAVLAVAGNIVTSWSWFGVNMLGRGLHSYGFIESAAFWLVLFIVSQLALIGLGAMPRRLWRSELAADAPSAQ